MVPGYHNLWQMKDNSKPTSERSQLLAVFFHVKLFGLIDPVVAGDSIAKRQVLNKFIDHRRRPQGHLLESVNSEAVELFLEDFADALDLFEIVNLGGRWV